MGSKKQVTPAEAQNARGKILRSGNVVADRTTAASEAAQNVAAVRATQNQQDTWQTFLRRSPRFSSNGQVATPAPSILCARTPKVTRKARDLTPPYLPPRPAHIGWDTPTRHIKWREKRPTRAKVGKIAFLGERCGTSGIPACMAVVDVSHIAGRSTAPPKLRTMEISFGIDKNELHLDTRLNLTPMDSSLHLLEKLHRVLRTKELDNWTGDKPPRRNAEGFIHHEEVFPFDGEGIDYYFVPSTDWDTDVRIPIAKKNRNGEHKTHYYKCPSQRATTSKLPPVTSHCSPYFVVWKAYWAISEKGRSLPRWARKEQMLIVKIGEIMTGQDDGEPADN